MRFKHLVLAGGIFLLLGAAPLGAANLPASAGGMAASSGYEPSLLPEGFSMTAKSAYGEAWNYVHPFLSLQEYYTDNLFNDPDNEESDFVTVISPGIWIALPASRQPLLDVETLNTAPGGIYLTRFDTEPNRRFQGYGLYRARFNRHNDFSDEDTDNHRAEGLLQYNFRGGLTIELFDIYEAEQDPYGTGTSGASLDEYDSNLFSTMAVYRVSPKTRLRANYSWYTLNYDDSASGFRDRDDNAMAFYAFHRFWPKTSLFLEYEFIDIDYERVLLSDSEEHHFFAGLVWEGTEKLEGRVKLGYGIKDFDRQNLNESRDFIGEGRIDYRFTPKTSVFLTATRQTDESDIVGVEDVLSHRVRVGYNQRITSKIRAVADLNYVRDSYRGGDVIVDFLRGKRTDDYYGFGLSVGFALREWLNLSGGYNYAERDSNFDTFDYERNTFFITLTGAI